MIKTIAFSDEIILWWTKEAFPESANGYELYLNGEMHGRTAKTHYLFPKLQAQQRYLICIKAYDDEKLLDEKSYSVLTGKAKNRLDVSKSPYNAVGDGSTLNTAALQRALDDCTANDVVYFPAGTYLSGALNVHSDTEIYLAENAILQGTENEVDYLPKIKSRFEGTEMLCYRSLLNMGELDQTNYGYSCRNIILRGEGSIFGGGKALAVSIIEAERTRLKEYLAKNVDYVKTCENEDTIPGRVRGRLINISNCENIVMSGLTMGYAASWNIHFVYSKNIVTCGCRICSNNQYGKDGKLLREKVWNGDGWDPDSSEDCAVFNTVFATGDDCVAIKSGKNPEGNRINRPTKNICVFDCFAEEGHAIAIGSEMSGGVENVRIWDCDISRLGCGLSVKSTRKRGGYIKNLFVENSVIRGFFMRNVPYNDDGESANELPVFSNFFFKKVTFLGGGYDKERDVCVSLCGFEEKGHNVQGVCFDDVTFAVAKSENVIEKQYTENLILRNIRYVNDFGKRSS